MNRIQVSGKILSIILLLITFTACSSGGSTDAIDDSDDDDSNINNSNEIGFEPTFINVQMIFSQNCSDCHVGSRESGVDLKNYNGVMNSVGDQYGTEIVQPGSANESPLINKIESNPQIGSRMPVDGPYLSSDRIDQIRDWINQGADNN